MVPRIRKLELPCAVYWIAVLAIPLRIVARLFYTGNTNFWVDGYIFFFNLAQSIAHGQGIAIDGIPTGFRTPLYSILLAGLTLGHQAFWPIIIAQSIIGAGTVVCTAVLAAQLFPGRAATSAAILAAAITALYPYYVFHDTAIQETSLFTFLTLVSVLMLLKAARTGNPVTGAEAGLILGLDVLTRATIAPFGLLAALWLVWHRRTRSAVVCGLVLLATVTPWVVRNYLALGDATLSTETGLEFWTGNNGFLFRYYPRQSSDISKAYAIGRLTPGDRQKLDGTTTSEAETSRIFFRKGLQYVKAHPTQFIIDALRKNLAAFNWLPSPRRGLLIDLAHFFSFGPVMLLGIWGMFRHRSHWREDCLIYFLFATFMLVSGIFWAHTSHRVYLDVYWIAFGSGVCAEKLFPRFRSPEIHAESVQ